MVYFLREQGKGGGDIETGRKSGNKLPTVAPDGRVQGLSLSLVVHKICTSSEVTGTREMLSSSS